MKVQMFISKVCEYFNIAPEFLFENNKCRKPEFVAIRHFVFLFLKQYTKLSLANIGSVFEKDHATVLNSIKKINGYIETEAYTKLQYDELNQIAKEIFEQKVKYYGLNKTINIFGKIINMNIKIKIS